MPFHSRRDAGWQLAARSTENRSDAEIKPVRVPLGTQSLDVLIVGGRDTPVIQMNRDAMARMRGDVVLEIVPRATHLFEEAGALEQVAAPATHWFECHLIRAQAETRASRVASR